MWKTPAATFLYLGDIWGIWIYSEEEFLDFVNNHHILIKAEQVTCETQINFLDTVVCQGLWFKWTGILETKVFFF